MIKTFASASEPFPAILGNSVLFSFLMETAMPEKIMLMSFLIETAIHDDREARRRLKIFWIQARRRRIFL